MSKRSREETERSECVHQCHKRLKDDNGESQRVSPMRYDQTFRFEDNGGATVQDDPFKLSAADHPDDDNDNKMGTASHSGSPDAADDDFGVLLYELASLNVGEEHPDDAQTCPVCSARVSLRQFADHVHRCLDAMDEGERNDLRTQTERDSDFATAYALKHGYVTEYATQCPSCGKSLLLGSGMNEHVNRCMDEMEAKQQRGGMGVDPDDDDEDSDIEGNGHCNSPKKADPLSRAQMIECASKLMTLQKGSHEFDSMLDMFGTLGFNKQNVKSVLEIEKQNGGRGALGSPSKSSRSEMNALSSIPEEEEDLSNHNRAGPKPAAEAFLIDDDDL